MVSISETRDVLLERVLSTFKGLSFKVKGDSFQWLVQVQFQKKFSTGSISENLNISLLYRALEIEKSF